MQIMVNYAIVHENTRSRNNLKYTNYKLLGFALCSSAGDKIWSISMASALVTLSFKPEQRSGSMFQLGGRITSATVPTQMSSVKELYHLQQLKENYLYLFKIINLFRATCDEHHCMKKKVKQLTKDCKAQCKTAFIKAESSESEETTDSSDGDTREDSEETE